MVTRYSFAVVVTVFLAGCGATNLESKLPESFSLQPGQTIEFCPSRTLLVKLSIRPQIKFLMNI